MYRILEHPEIGHIERTGYPSWMQERDEDGDDDDYYDNQEDEWDESE